MQVNFLVNFSCNLTCEKRGDCCSDYSICEMIEESKNTKCQTKYCKYCTNDSLTCLKCLNQNLFYKNNCFKKCPKETTEISQYNICISKSCKIPHCEICEGNECKKCQFCQDCSLYSLK